jgi:hypothetical protein
LEQRITSAFPQFAQKRADEGFSVWQLGHFIGDGSLDLRQLRHAAGISEGRLWMVNILACYWSPDQSVVVRRFCSPNINAPPIIHILTRILFTGMLNGK